MKNTFFSVLLLVVLSAACISPMNRISDNQKISENKTNEIDNNQTFISDHPITENAEFTELKRMITALYSDGNVIGTDRYKNFKDQLESVKGAIPESEYNDLNYKLYEIGPEKFALEDDEQKATNSQAQQNQQKDARIDQLPECTVENQKFTVTPISLSLLQEIEPLGSLGPPGHTLPTEHMYFHISATGATTSTVDLRSPVDAYVLDINSGLDGQTGKEEYSIGLASCKNTRIYFNHVKKISEELKKVLAESKCEEMSDNPGNLCIKSIFHKVDAGEILGGVGGYQGNFDFGAYDLTYENNYVNKSRYQNSRTLHIVCPLEFYDEKTKMSLYAKISSRTKEPKCGQIMYDAANSLQGNWFFGSGSPGGLWEEHLAFVYDSKNPEIAVISIAGKITSPGKWEFSEKISGLANRKFSEVTADGNIYCYESSKQTGIIIVQLADANTIKIEHQTGNCSGQYSFKNPLVYGR